MYQDYQKFSANLSVQNQEECETENENGGNEAKENTVPPNMTDGSVTMKTEKNTIHCLTIIGQIEGHYILPSQNKTTKYEHVIPQIVAVEEDPNIDGLLILLNTVGGDVEAGLAIAELVAGMKKPPVSLVLGGGHSIGVPLAVAANYSFIAPSATMTIHPVRMSGTLVGAPQTYNYFAKMQDRVSDFITRNSGIKAGRLTELMFDTKQLALDVGTMLIGEEAVAESIIGEVGGLLEAREKLFGLIAEKRSNQGNENPVSDIPNE